MGRKEAKGKRRRIRLAKGDQFHLAPVPHLAQVSFLALGMAVQPPRPAGSENIFGGHSRRSGRSTLLAGMKEPRDGDRWERPLHEKSH